MPARSSARRSHTAGPHTHTSCRDCRVWRVVSTHSTIRSGIEGHVQARRLALSLVVLQLVSHLALLSYEYGPAVLPPCHLRARMPPDARQMSVCKVPRYLLHACLLVICAGVALIPLELCAAAPLATIWSWSYAAPSSAPWRRSSTGADAPRAPSASAHSRRTAPGWRPPPPRGGTWAGSSPGSGCGCGVGIGSGVGCVLAASSAEA